MFSLGFEMGKIGQACGRFMFRESGKCLALLLLAFSFSSTTVAAQDSPPEVQYPIALDLAPDGSLVVVDLNLPGVWRLDAAGGLPQLLYRGTKQLRKPMNRPRCCVVLEDGSILVGDTATREIYKLAADGSGEPQPLTGGILGIPNSLALAADGTLYIADLETRFVFKVPASGGTPEKYSDVNARGLLVTNDGQLLAVTPTAQPLVKIAADGSSEAIVKERAFQFPHNVALLEDGSMLVTDGYAHCVWQVTADGAVSKWIEGEPLKNPVGIVNSADAVFVADPHAKQVFKIGLADKQIQPLITSP